MFAFKPSSRVVLSVARNLVTRGNCFIDKVHRAQRSEERGLPLEMLKEATLSNVHHNWDS